jgi:hypothetical protein
LTTRLGERSERGYIPPEVFSRKAIRKVAGHSRMLWFLPVFALVLGCLVGVEISAARPDRFAVAFWAVVASAFFAVSVLVGVLRAADRRFLKDLDILVSEPPLSSHGVLRRYEIHVGLVLIHALFHTPFRPAESEQLKFDLWLACGVTALFGWWSLSGLFMTPTVIWRNLHGGQDVSAQDLLVALRTAAE